MGNSLGGLLGGNSGNQQGNSLGYGPELQCCDAVVDPLTLLSTIGAIAAASYVLRQGVIDYEIMGKRKRRSFESFHSVFQQGTFIPFFVKILNFVAKNRTSMTLKSLKQEKLQSSLVWIIEIRN